MTGSLEGEHATEPICLVTGATSGIGLAAAISLSRRSSRLGLICRDEIRGKEAQETIRRANPAAGPIEVWIADLASFSSVRNAAQAIRATYPRVDVLVNNAGGVFSRREISQDGLEMHFATNYAGHFLLTALLIEKLLQSKRPRVITTTSSLYRLGRLRLDDFAFARPYHLVLGYAQSKLAGVYFTLELARRFQAVPIAANCVNPGFIKTAIYRGTSGHQRWLTRCCERFSREPNLAGELIARVAMDENFLAVSGRCFSPSGEQVLSPRARDLEVGDALWRRSVDWLTQDEAARLQCLQDSQNSERSRLPAIAFSG